MRELINRVRRATVMCEHPLISPVDLELAEPGCDAHLPTLAAARAEAETRAIRIALRCTGNNVSEAARRMGTTRVTLYRLMRRYGFSVPAAGQSGAGNSAGQAGSASAFRFPTPATLEST